MGTSNSYGGPGGGTPLVPSWLGGGENPSSDGTDAGKEQGSPDGGSDDKGDKKSTDAPPQKQDKSLPTTSGRDRFRGSRTSFTKFVKSGGTNRAALGRAVSTYISRSSGGARTAAQRMGSSRKVTSGLVRFIDTVRTEGVQAALEKFKISDLLGKPIDEVFLGLMDFICPSGGNVDEGIARNAFIETIADLANAGITDLENISTEQFQVVIELYATHSIEARLCNDIGTKLTIAPENLAEFERTQSQLHEFIFRGVQDAVSRHENDFRNLTSVDTDRFVNQVYQEAFSLLQSIGEAQSHL